MESGIQDLTNDLKRVYVSTYALKKICVCHVQGKNYKKIKKHTRAIRVHEKQRMKNRFDFRFFKNLSNSK